MKRKTPAELERYKVGKATRALVRLKHSLAADEELNEVLPNTLEEFDEALARGELKALEADITDVLGAEGN